jgi:transcriptional regulator with GAF, ATPase, and Fis domain
MLVDITDRVLAEQERNRLQQQNLYLREEIKSEYNFDEIVGGSAALQTVLATVGQVAPTDSTVLILGETGTGKELVARAVHNASRRKDKPLIKVNCSALPTGLVESELFGHEKGAFTGATEKRTGRFELADGGTIFLDEVGELPLETQVKLLRVLQEREFERVGSAKTIRVDVRVIAATNRDLRQAIAEGRFRQDLYYRLNVFPVHLPSLRQRTEDVPLLVHYFVERYAAKVGRTITGVSAEAMERLARYPWPGNVRELENVIERAVILSTGPELSVGPELLPMPAAAPAASPPAGVGPVDDAAALEDVDRRHIVAVLKRTGWRIDGPNGAARLLNMNPSTLRSRMQKLGIRRSAAELS